MKRICHALVAVMAWAFAGLAASAVDSGGSAAMPAQAGEALFAENCLQCHDGSVPRAPHVITFNMMSSESILEALTSGAMRQQGAALSESERIAIADYLSGGSSRPGSIRRCAADSKVQVSSGLPAWSSWGGDVANQRFQPPHHTGITPGNVGNLQLQWAFAYPGASRARSQPLVYGDTVFVGSQSGTVYALDLASGCARWTYEAGAEVRNGPAIALLPGDDEPLLVFGDFSARVHALDATTGRQRWLQSVATHPDATITGSVKYHDGRLYVPISSSEWATAADPGYACCTFRGAVAALDASDGKPLWTTSVIPEEPRATGDRNPAGAERIAPAGAPVWNSPTIDSVRGMLYVGTGEAYTSPASGASDAVVAMRLGTGEIAWTRQLLAGDAWNMACFIGGGGNCPEENGPDLDIGAATILWSGEDGDLLFVGQKSGDVYALDPDAAGQTVWHRKLGRGGYAGGVHWGMTASPEALFVPIADTDFLGLSKEPGYPGMHALNPLTGEPYWYTRTDERCPDEEKPACDPGMSAAATNSGSLIYAGGFDGVLRIYNAATGKVVWDFNSLQAFTTVSGETARGGSIESDGPVVSNGRLLVNSGYSFGGRMPGNVLLVFGISEQAEGGSAGE